MVIIDAEGVEYVTGKGRIIERVEPVAPAKPEPVAPAKPELVSTGAGPEPKGIEFEQVTCGRCAGMGRRSDRGWGPNHKGICYRCHGACVVDTANGYRARMAFYKMRVMRGLVPRG
ncbi:hypothetical protein [Streptomyces reniochalinae]